MFTCYSQRMLNPFRGSMNCVQYRSADAVTADGVHWDIYVSNEGLAAGLPEPRRAQVSDIRFGSWSKQHGLRRGPIFPSDDFLRMEALGQRVYEHLLDVHQQLPFPFRDVYELWLLDSRLRPLALLDSALAATDLQSGSVARWSPGLSCRRSFTTGAAAALGLDPNQPEAIADYLASYVNRLAGSEVRTQLYRRNADGSGTAVADGSTDPEWLAQPLFPADFIRTSGHDAAHEQLLGDFIRWQAPWHLLRHDLDRDTRRTLEQHARVQPLKVASQHLLYPEIVDRGVIDAARVEARLRASMPVTPTQEKVLSTFYIELCPEVANQSP